VNTENLFVVGLVGGAVIFILISLAYQHLYDRCVAMYSNIEDVSECVWLLQND
jgi:hypothetical protein